MVRKINGAVFIGMVITAIVGMLFSLIDAPDKVVSSVPSLAPTFEWHLRTSRNLQYGYVGCYPYIYVCRFL